MADAFICDAVRTPIGRSAGGLAPVRADDLGAIPLKALQDRNPGVDWEAVEDVVFGCANQAGEDNRNVARMALLLAGLPSSIPGSTVNRLCGSGLEAVAQAARAVMLGEADAYVGGGVESMTRAPWVMPKPSRALRAEVLAAARAELAQTGADGFTPGVVVARFLGRGAGRTTLFRWVRSARTDEVASPGASTPALAPPSPALAELLRAALEAEIEAAAPRIVAGALRRLEGQAVPASLRL